MEPLTQTYEGKAGRAPLPARISVVGNAGDPYVLSGGSCIVGAGKDADLIVTDETVSRLHLELTLVPEGLQLVDLGSRNGTFFLGQRVERAILSLGSVIRLGRVELRLDADETALQAQSANDGDCGGDGQLIGSSPALQGVRSILRRLEGSLISVLITGESGTGKEVVARQIHARSLAGKGPFVALNCGALDRALVRSELFGHARGAFTGAVESRAGAFEAASNGTLFLDEIGELPQEIQPVLLRALETGVVQRVGETEERKVKVRLLAATNRKLESLVNEGKFREDLYYRLLVVQLELPPLRERPGDIPALIRHFTKELGVTPFSDQVIAEFEARTWAGNVRELKNAVLAYSAVGALPPAMNPRSIDLDGALRAAIDLGAPYVRQKEQLSARFQRIYLDMLMAYTNSNQSEAARISGLDRTYLNKVLRKLS